MTDDRIIEETEWARLEGALDGWECRRVEFVVEFRNLNERDWLGRREFPAAHTPTDDERQTRLKYVIDAAVPVDELPSWRFRDSWRIADAVRTAGFRRSEVPEPSEPGEHGGTIPLCGMLDVWMALCGTSHPEFDAFYAEHGYAETWARILAAVRERRAAPQGEPSGARTEAVHRWPPTTGGALTNPPRDMNDEFVAGARWATQGEPSDAQVKAALDAYLDGSEEGDRQRGPMGAAAVTEQRENR